MIHPSVTRAIALALVALAPARALSGQVTTDRGATTPAVTAARAALRALPDSIRSGATFSFDSTERSNWYYVPLDRKGVTLARMTADARARRFTSAHGAQPARLRHCKEHHAPRVDPPRHRGGRPARGPS